MDIRKVINTVSLRNYWVTGTKIVCVGRNYAEHAKGVKHVVEFFGSFFVSPTIFLGFLIGSDLACISKG